MKTVIFYDPSNKASRIVRGEFPGARHCVTGGEDKVTSRSIRKTKKSMAALLELDDEKKFLSPEQRSDLADRAGDAYGDKPKKARKPKDPLIRSRNESIEEYKVRLCAYLKTL